VEERGYYSVAFREAVRNKMTDLVPRRLFQLFIKTFQNLHSVLQKELYNFESLCKFIQRTCIIFLTVVMQQNTPKFTSDSYGSMRLPLVV
jgi:hypothetical protein